MLRNFHHNLIKRVRKIPRHFDEQFENKKTVFIMKLLRVKNFREIKTWIIKRNLGKLLLRTISKIGVDSEDTYLEKLHKIVENWIDYIVVVWIVELFICSFCNIIVIKIMTWNYFATRNWNMKDKRVNAINCFFPHKCDDLLLQSLWKPT